VSTEDRLSRKTVIALVGIGLTLVGAVLAVANLVAMYQGHNLGLVPISSMFTVVGMAVCSRNTLDN